MPCNFNHTLLTHQTFLQIQRLAIQHKPAPSRPAQPSQYLVLHFKYRSKKSWSYQLHYRIASKVVLHLLLQLRRIKNMSPRLIAAVQKQQPDRGGRCCRGIKMKVQALRQSRPPGMHEAQRWLLPVHPAKHQGLELVLNADSESSPCTGSML